MAKKKTTRSRTSAAKSAGRMESIGKKLDETTAVQAAEAALRMAREELSKAEGMYRDARSKAAAEVKDLANKDVGQILQSTLNYIRRHPAQGLIVSALLGFFLGRLFRR